MVAILDARYLVAFTAILSVAYQSVFFAITAAFRFDKLTDFAGGTGFVVNALVTLVMSGGGYHARQVALSAMQIIWGLRLALFLLFRILKWGEDSRFDGMRDSLPKLAVFWSLQALWVFSVSLPVTLVNADTRGLAGSISIGAVDLIGWALFAAGLALETVADQQKLAFKSAPAKAWCDVGVWRWSRHPNYFGEWLIWWGIFVSAASQLRGGELVAAAASPLFIMSLLLGLSGMPIQERGWNKKYGRMAGFDEWKASTSPVVPLPPTVYRALPRVVKTVLLFEWPLYSAGIDQGSDAGDQRSRSGERRQR